jgi:hypothetical protein
MHCHIWCHSWLQHETHPILVLFLCPPGCCYICGTNLQKAGKLSDGLVLSKMFCRHLAQGTSKVEALSGLSSSTCRRMKRACLPTVGRRCGDWLPHLKFVLDIGFLHLASVFKLVLYSTFFYSGDTSLSVYLSSWIVSPCDA